MYAGTIAKRYATALANFAAERGEERVVFDEARSLAMYMGEVTQLRETVVAPTIDVERKVALMSKCVGGQLSESMERFVRMVFVHRRERYLEFMLHSLVRIVKMRHAIVDVELTTAAPIDEPTKQRIAELVKQMTGSREAELNCRVDEDLIGGFRLRMDDRQVDASIRTQLETVRRGLVGNNKRIL